MCGVCVHVSPSVPDIQLQGFPHIISCVCVCVSPSVPDIQFQGFPHIISCVCVCVSVHA